MKYISLSSVLAENLGMLEYDVNRIILTAPYRYKVFEIPKRKAGEFRTIAQPAFELKVIQRWVISNFLSDLPVHDAATAYVKGRGIKNNAYLHSKNKYILKMDFSNFFPSIKYKDICKHIENHKPKFLNADDIKGVCRLLVRKDKETKNLELSIGAPSSPLISNSIMYEFDKIISEYSKKHGVVYTRYADDLTFSTRKPDLLKDVEKYVVSTVRKIKSPKLKVNDKKTIHVSSNMKRIVTGLILTPDGKVSIGRERKRLISSMIDYYMKGRLDDDQIKRLRGLLAFAFDVEKDFIVRMKEKYGSSIIESILKMSF